MKRYPNAGAGPGPIVFAAPWMLGALLLYLVPMAMLAWLSLMHWDGLSWSSVSWAGSKNFQALAGDAWFHKALINSAVYTAMNVPVQLAAALVLALLVHRSRRRAAWATLYYLPHVLGGVATILIWWWLLNPQVGPINRSIRALWEWLDGPVRLLGGPGTAAWGAPPWLYSPDWAKPSLVLMNVWQAGGGMLIILAALLRSGRLLHDAASIDGAGPVRRFIHVTLPQVSPAILFNLVTGAIFSMQEFDQPLLLSNFQQQDSLLFFSTYLFQSAFERNELGYAAAQAWILLALLLAFIGLCIMVSKRWVHYDMEEGVT